MSATAWFHCFAGIAGDMALGALVDAGADLDEVLSLVRRVPVDGWAVGAEAVSRNGLAATRIVVRAPDTAIVRTHAHIRGLLAEARLPARVLDRALSV
ncbi:MAG TPA: nickel insertion protein, partial [Acidimicrobiales bacterium]|nr:nickel insertion protein [Acidimicrobiales bacterium]